MTIAACSDSLRANRGYAAIHRRRLSRRLRRDRAAFGLVEPAGEARHQARLFGSPRLLHERIGVASGARGLCDPRHRIGHRRRARGIDHVVGRQFGQMIGRPAAADGVRDLLRLRHHRDQRDVGKQRQPAQRGMHVERADAAGLHDEDHFALRLLHDRGNRDRPHRGETSAAGDEHDAPRMALPEKGTAVRSRQLDAVPGADFVAERRGYLPVRNLSDVKVQQVIVRSAFQRKGRAVGPCRESLKLQLAILAGKVVERLRQFDVDAHHVGRELNGLRHFRRQRDRLGSGLNCNIEIGDDSGLAGMDHVVAAAVAAEHRAVDQAHAAGAADSGAAIVRKIDTVHQRPIEQKLAAIRQKRLVVDRDFANL